TRGCHAQNLKHIWNLRGAETSEVRIQRFSGYPPPQVTGTTASFAVSFPVVISSGNRRMAAVSEMLRLRLKPLGVLRIRGSHERERAAESVDDFLIVPLIAEESVRAPLPAGW